MYQWPIDLKKEGSIPKMINFCEEIIDQLGEESKVGNNMIKILPSFEMSNNTKQKMLRPTGKNVFVDYDSYIKFELERRIIYISADSPDKRPFIYWGGEKPFDPNNYKAYLEVLIIHPMKDPRADVVYRDNDLCNLKLTNITFHAKKSAEPLSATILNNSSQNIDLNKPGEIITHEERTALNDAIFGKEEEFVMSDKVRSMFGKVAKQKGGLSALEQIYIQKGNITSSDASQDYTFKWLGVKSYTIKGGTSYKAHFKDIVIKSGFKHPLDAARAYNEFIIKHGLPYPVNNIPGFLELEIINKRKSAQLDDYTTTKLLETILERVAKANV